jgi:hypothetical protein
MGDILSGRKSDVAKAVVEICVWRWRYLHISDGLRKCASGEKRSATQAEATQEQEGQTKPH